MNSDIEPYLRTIIATPLRLKAARAIVGVCQLSSWKALTKKERPSVADMKRFLVLSKLEREYMVLSLVARVPNEPPQRSLGTPIRPNRPQQPLMGPPYPLLVWVGSPLNA